MILNDIPAELRPQIQRIIEVRSRQDESSCVIWTGYRTEKGYGQFMLYRAGRSSHVRAHRAVWILEHGPIDDASLVIDHTCGNRSCVNPAHLELVTNEMNLHRGDDRQGRPRREMRVPPLERTSCVHGHPWPQYLRLFQQNGRQRARCAACSSRSARSSQTVG